MVSTCQASALSVLGLLIVSVLSRTSVSESQLGVYGQRQLSTTIQRIVGDATLQAEVSRQDTDPLIALVHNSEASANLRAAKRLNDESGFAPSEPIMDALVELSKDQDLLIRALAAENA